MRSCDRSLALSCFFICFTCVCVCVCVCVCGLETAQGEAVKVAGWTVAPTAPRSATYLPHQFLLLDLELTQLLFDFMQLVGRFAPTLTFFCQRLKFSLKLVNLVQHLRDDMTEKTESGSGTTQPHLLRLNLLHLGTKFFAVCVEFRHNL